MARMDVARRAVARYWLPRRPPDFLVVHSIRSPRCSTARPTLPDGIHDRAAGLLPPHPPRPGTSTSQCSLTTD